MKINEDILDHLEAIEDLARTGMTEATIVANFSFSLEEWEDVKQQHPEISKALYIGKHKGISEVSKALFDEAKDPKGSVSAKKFFLQSRDPENWREIKQTKEVNMRIGQISGHDVDYVESVLNDLRMEENE